MDIGEVTAERRSKETSSERFRYDIEKDDEKNDAGRGYLIAVNVQSAQSGRT